MRKLPIAASALALLTATAMAQTPTTPGTSPSHPVATSPASQSAKVNPLAQDDVSQIIGTAVYGSDDKKIGDVATVLMQPQDKKVDQLVVRAGGLLGVGGHLVALPLDAFSWNADDGTFKIAKTADDLKSMAAWTGVSTSSTMSGSSAPAKTTTPSDKDGR